MGQAMAAEADSKLGFARLRAAEARRRSADTHDRAAAVEDRAAMFWQLSGDAEREDAHRAAAQRHRDSAAADREKRPV